MKKKKKVPGRPEDCQLEDCRHCDSIGLCRQTLKPVDIKAAQSEAVKASQGSIVYEDTYAPGG